MNWRVKQLISSFLCMSLFAQTAFGALGESIRFDALRPIPQTLLQNIPLNFVQVQDVFNSSQKNQPTVVIIQDVHLNAQAQKNIAATIEYLINQNQITKVGVEGAFGVFDFTRFRSFPAQNIVKEVADEFLEAKLIAGPSYSGITSKKEIPFVGIDSEKHHTANVDAYRDSLAFQENVLASLEKRAQKNSSQKGKFLNSKLKSFDKATESYHNGNLSLDVYLEKLSLFGDEPTLTLSQFKEALELEKKIDFTAANQQRKKILSSLIPKLNKKETEMLMQKSLAFRAGQTTSGQYYQYFKRLCSKYNVDIRLEKEFEQYITYILLVDTLKADKLLADLDFWEKQITESLVLTNQEKQLIDESKKLRLSKRLVNFELTPSEWNQYKKGDYSSFENFYHQADIRSEYMANEVESLDGNMAIVIGGFHTSYVTDQFKKKNQSYIVLSPKLTKIDSHKGSHYLSVFSREKTPLDRLFKGEKLFVYPPQVNVGFAHNENLTTTSRMLTKSAVQSVAAGEGLNSRKTEVSVQKRGPGIFRVALRVGKKFISFLVSRNKTDLSFSLGPEQEFSVSEQKSSRSQLLLSFPDVKNLPLFVFLIVFESLAFSAVLFYFLFFYQNVAPFESTVSWFKFLGQLIETGFIESLLWVALHFIVDFVRRFIFKNKIVDSSTGQEIKRGFSALFNMLIWSLSFAGLGAIGVFAVLSAIDAHGLSQATLAVISSLSFFLPHVIAHLVYDFVIEPSSRLNMFGGSSEGNLYLSIGRLGMAGEMKERRGGGRIVLPIGSESRPTIGFEKNFYFSVQLKVQYSSDGDYLALWSDQRAETLEDKFREKERRYNLDQEIIIGRNEDAPGTFHVPDTLRRVSDHNTMVRVKKSEQDESYHLEVMDIGSLNGTITRLGLPYGQEILLGGMGLIRSENNDDSNFIGEPAELGGSLAVPVKGSVHVRYLDEIYVITREGNEIVFTYPDGTVIRPLESSIRLIPGKVSIIKRKEELTDILIVVFPTKDEVGITVLDKETEGDSRLLLFPDKGNDLKWLIPMVILESAVVTFLVFYFLWQNIGILNVGLADLGPEFLDDVFDISIRVSLAWVFIHFILDAFQRFITKKEIWGSNTEKEIRRTPLDFVAMLGMAILLSTAGISGLAVFIMVLKLSSVSVLNFGVYAMVSFGVLHAFGHLIYDLYAKPSSRLLLFWRLPWVNEKKVDSLANVMASQDLQSLYVHQQEDAQKFVSRYQSTPDRAPAWIRKSVEDSVRWWSINTEFAKEEVIKKSLQNKGQRAHIVKAFVKALEQIKSLQGPVVKLKLTSQGKGGKVTSLLERTAWVRYKENKGTPKYFRVWKDQNQFYVQAYDQAYSKVWENPLAADLGTFLTIGGHQENVDKVVEGVAAQFLRIQVDAEDKIVVEDLRNQPQAVQQGNFLPISVYLNKSQRENWPEDLDPFIDQPKLASDDPEKDYMIHLHPKALHLQNQILKLNTKRTPENFLKRLKINIGGAFFALDPSGFLSLKLNGARYDLPFGNNGRTLSIARESGADFLLNLDRISRQEHALIGIDQENAIFIADQASKGGTYVHIPRLAFKNSQKPNARLQNKTRLTDLKKGEEGKLFHAFIGLDGEIREKKFSDLSTIRDDVWLASQGDILATFDVTEKGGMALESYEWVYGLSNQKELLELDPLEAVSIVYDTTRINLEASSPFDTTVRPVLIDDQRILEKLNDASTFVYPNAIFKTQADIKTAAIAFGIHGEHVRNLERSEEKQKLIGQIHRGEVMVLESTTDSAKLYFVYAPGFDEISNASVRTKAPGVEKTSSLIALLSGLPDGGEGHLISVNLGIGGKSDGGFLHLPFSEEREVVLEFPGSRKVKAKIVMSEPGEPPQIEFHDESRTDVKEKTFPFKRKITLGRNPDTETHFHVPDFRPEDQKEISRAKVGVTAVNVSDSEYVLDIHDNHSLNGTSIEARLKEDEELGLGGDGFGGSLGLRTVNRVVVTSHGREYRFSQNSNHFYVHFDNEVRSFNKGDAVLVNARKLTIIDPSQISDLSESDGAFVFQIGSSALPSMAVTALPSTRGIKVKILSESQNQDDGAIKQKTRVILKSFLIWLSPFIFTLFFGSPQAAASIDKNFQTRPDILIVHNKEKEKNESQTVAKFVSKIGPSPQSLGLKNLYADLMQQDFSDVDEALMKKAIEALYLVKEKGYSVKKALEETGLLQLQENHVVLLDGNQEKDLSKKIKALKKLAGSNGHIFVVAQTEPLYKKLVRIIGENSILIPVNGPQTKAFNSDNPGVVYAAALDDYLMQSPATAQFYSTLTKVNVIKSSGILDWVIDERLRKDSPFRNTRQLFILEEILSLLALFDGTRPSVETFRKALEAASQAA